MGRVNVTRDTTIPGKIEGTVNMMEKFAVR